MKLRSAMLCLVLALLSALALLLPAVGRAQPGPEPTPLLGEPVVVTPLVTAASSSTERPDIAYPTSTAAAEASRGPDTCEPNDARSRACSITLDAVNGPYTFQPAGDQDWYRIELPSAGLQTVVTVRGTAGLDLLTTLSRDDGTPLGEIASPAISTTLAPDIAGSVLVRVENRDPGAGERDQYNLEVRQVLPPPPVAPPAEGGAALPPDDLENNWSPATAAAIAPGVVYDLSFVCPVPWGCVGGDHDYLRLPVKAGLRYLIATFDLGPGVDTVLELFWGDELIPLAANDDARAGSSFLSVLRWVAPADGEAIVRVGPRTGGLAPIVADEKTGTYRLAVALAESDLARQLEDRIAEQTNGPTPAPTIRTTTPATGGSAGGAPAPPPAPTAAPQQAPTAPAISADAPTGPARVRAAQTALREGPSAAAPEILTLPAEAVVALLGQSSGAWVRVQPAESVLPGWVRGVDLVREPEVSPTAASVTPTATAATVGEADGTQTPAIPDLIVERLEPASPPLPALPLPRVLLSLTVQVIAVAEPPRVSPGKPIPTIGPDMARPLRGIRVHLVNVFGDVLAEALTASDGQVTLTSNLDPGSAVFVQLPAVGLRIPVEPGQTTAQIAIPTGAGGRQ